MRGLNFGAADMAERAADRRCRRQRAWLRRAPPRGTTCARARAKACAATFSPGLRGRLMPGPPLRGKFRQRKACCAWFGHGPRRAASLSGAPPAPRVRHAGERCSAAPLTHSGAGHELALPQQAALCPDASAARADNEKLFGVFLRHSASARLFPHHLPNTIPGCTRRDGRRRSRHLSLFLRSPWTAFSFLA